jgi:CMP/dCMP kinase
MEKKSIITIAGMLGAGKSSTARLVAEELGYQHFSSGDLMRAIGKERGIDDICQVNIAGEKDPTFDHMVDERLRQIGQTESDIVIDSRMAWHWMPYSFKVYLDIPLEVAVPRILAGISPERRDTEHIPDSPEEYKELLQQRINSENRRYKSLYNVTGADLTQYDLVLNTTDMPIEDVVKSVIAAYRAWLG